jgi:DNA invertase Pin-like site-specific DNA recombinase
MNERYIAYYRVSTVMQGRTGFGLDAQKADVYRFIQDNELLGEFTEVESGRNNARPELEKAIEACKQHKAKLVIAKLDRLSRNVLFIETLKQKGVKFVCCDIPEANELVIGIMAVMAQWESNMISERTKKSLAARKARGERVGGSSKAHCDMMRAKRKPVEYDPKLVYLIKSLREGGFAFHVIASEATKQGYLTKHGRKHSATSIMRILNSLESVPRSVNLLTN